MKLNPQAKSWLNELRAALQREAAPKKSGLVGRLFGARKEEPQAPPSDPVDLLMDCKIGRFQIGKMLGTGCSGAVFEVVDTELDAHDLMAVKVLSRPTPEEATEAEAALFHREVAIGQKLDHPTVVRILETQEHDLARFVFMERVTGHTLEHSFEAAWDKKRCLKVFSELTEGLHYAHSQGVVHRDLKPENIMLTAEQEVKILDFGMAQLKGSVEVTITGQFKGTPMYTSPEQIKSSKNVSPACDQFSLGIMLFQAISGDFPYVLDPKQPMQALFVRLQQPARLLREVAPEESEELEAALARMLAMEPEDRFPDLKQAFDAVAPALD